MPFTHHKCITFYLFRDLYELLDSPVLRNDDPDCAFFAWENFGNEFYNVQSVFDMPEDRITFAEHLYKNNDSSHNNGNEVRKEFIEVISNNYNQYNQAK